MAPRKRPPPAVWSRRLRLAIPGVALWIGTLVLLAGPESWRRLPGMLWGVYAAIAALLLLSIFALLRERTLHKLVVEHEGRVCPGCTYPLPGQEGQVRCPECGRTVDLERTIEQWRQFTSW